MSSWIRLAAVSLLVLSVLAVAACGSASSSGNPSAAASPDASAPAASASAPAASASASAAASPAAAGGDLLALVPETVGEVPMSATEIDGAAYVSANVGRQLGPILAAVGKTPADVQVATATGSSTGGATLFIDVVRIDGADPAAALEAFQTAAAAVPGAQVEASEVDGRQVVMVTTSSYTLAATTVGDALVYIQSPDAALVEAAIAALPTA